MSDYLREAKKIKEEIIANRRYLHENPEIGHKLPVTTKYIIEKLNELGIESKEIAESAVVAVLGKPGEKTILLRADMDALQIVEAIDEEYESKNKGHMHACGHDMHAAMLLGAAKILKENEDKLEGQVKLMFQPAEESLTGTLEMIKAGVLENPKVDAAVALHVFPAMYAEKAGTIGVQSGPVMAGSQNFKIEITGRGGHGAYPETAIDPITIGHHIFSQINTIKMREIAATEPLVSTFGQFSFGETFNVIPNEGVMQGTFRFFNPDVGKYVIKRFEDIVETTTKLFDGEVKLTMLGHTPPNINNKDLAEKSRGYLKEALGEDYVMDFEMKAMGSEDFAYLSEKVPSLFIPILAGSPDEGYTVPVHNPGTRFDEDALPYGTATLVTVAIEWLKDNK